MDNPLKAAIFKAKVEPVPRVFETSKKEIGSAKPGQEVGLCVYGKVQSIHDDGRVYVKVNSVELDSPDNESEVEDKVTGKPKPIYVKTQESHAP